MSLRPLLASLLLLAAVGTAATAPSAPAPASPVTWAKDIAPIINQSCGACHRPDGPGPFSLLTYPEVQAHARQIAEVTASRFMPPWLPEPTEIPLSHARRLTDAQVSLFQQWNVAGAPEGDVRLAPTVPSFPEGWVLGAPDRVVVLPHPYVLPAETTSPFRCFLLPLALPGDRWLRAIQFRPGNRAVVRHAILFADPTGTARKLAAQSGTVGYAAPDAGLGPNASRLAEWAVGSSPWILPAGVAEKLPAHADLVLLLRFETDGQPETVESRVGLYFAPSPPSSVPISVTLGSRDLILQPAQVGTITDSVTLPVAARLLRMTPHGHPVCRTLSVQALPPRGPILSLLQINDWNADWQDSYAPADPPLLPAGTRLTIRWTVDDSVNNPRNPSSPPMTAQQGLLYSDDMATVRLELLAADPSAMVMLRNAADAPLPVPIITLSAPDRHG